MTSSCISGMKQSKTQLTRYLEHSKKSLSVFCTKFKTCWICWIICDRSWDWKNSLMSLMKSSFYLKLLSASSYSFLSASRLFDSSSCYSFKDDSAIGFSSLTSFFYWTAFNYFSCSIIFKSSLPIYAESLNFSSLNFW